MRGPAPPRTGPLAPRIAPQFLLAGADTCWTMTPLLALLVILAAPRVSGEDPRLVRLYEQVAADFDERRGGFVRGDGTPIEGAVELAFARGREEGDPEWLARGHATVVGMHSLIDSTGGGFFMRFRDADPSQTGFDKPTWANARRLENLIDAWQRGGNEAARAVAAGVVEYMDRVLADGRGGFVPGQVGDRDLVPEANGYAIHAWLRWAAATAEPRPRDFALRSLDRVWESCWNEGLGLTRRTAFGEHTSAPLLADQALMGRAYVLGAHIGGREVDLDRATMLGDLLLARFEIPEKGGFAERATPKNGGRETNRGGKEFSTNAHAVRFLAELASITGDRRYRDAARRAERAFEKNFVRAGVYAADWALALRALESPDLPPRPRWKDPPVRKESPRVFRPGR